MSTRKRQTTLFALWLPKAASSSRSNPNDEDKSFVLPQGDTHTPHTPPAPLTALPPTGLALQWQIQISDGIRRFCYPGSAYVDCMRWLPSTKTTSNIKRLFSELPTLSQYNTLTLYESLMVVTFVNQCNPNKNINFVCRQSYFKIISAIVFTVLLLKNL